LDQRRRGAEWRAQDPPGGRTLVTDADRTARFEPRAPREAWPSLGSGDHSAVTSLDGPLAATTPKRAAAVPGYVSPTLVLVAAVSILQGYMLLNVLPDGKWQISAVLFAAVSFPLSVALTRPGGRGTRPITEKAVAPSAALVGMMTVAALVVDRPSVTHLLGVSDLTFALVTLIAVLANELPARHSGPD
jgi:hypothetical protein